jgi:biopolymer transport protein ExbD
MARLRSGPVDSKVDMPITPMLDMTFQLLAFFLLTFQPHSALEVSLAFSLPALGKDRPVEPMPEVSISEPLVAEPARFTVMVKTMRDGVNDGNISALILEEPEGQTLIRDVDSLRKTLEKLRPRDGSGQIRIAPECRLKYSCVMEVMDACLQSGFTHVGFAAPPDLASQ